MTIRHYVEFAQVPCLSEPAREGTERGKLHIMSFVRERRLSAIPGATRPEPLRRRARPQGGCESASARGMLKLPKANGLVRLY